MRLDAIVLVIVIVFGALWLGITLAGVALTMPYGLLVLIPAAIVLGVLGVVIYQRLTNKEDDYYDKNVDK